MKKVISLLLAVLMLVSVVPMAASAAECEHEFYDQLFKDGKATCSVPGGEFSKCKKCGKTYRLYDYYDKNNHVNTEVRNVKDPTCAEDGYTGDTYCLDCGRRASTGRTIPATNNHDYSIEVRREPGSCGKLEKIYYKCSTCTAERYWNGSYDRDNHQGGTEIRYATQAKCDISGYTGDLYCKGCGQPLEYGETIPAKGHSFNYHSDGNATCYRDGTKSAWCSNMCGIKNTVQDEGSMLPHTDENRDGFCDRVHCRADTTNGCTHSCHKGGFFYKIALFFWKLFKINKECACGVYHY